MCSIFDHKMKNMNHSNSSGHRLNVFFLVLLGFIILIFADHAFSSMGNAGYYGKLPTEEFLSAMVPKERFLLVFMKNIQEEIKARKAEGSLVIQWGIEIPVSPVEELRQAYAKEVERNLQLLAEIDRLERKARQKADLSVLSALSGLRQKVIEIFQYSALGESPLVQKYPPSESEMSQKNSEVQPPVSTTDGHSTPEIFFEQWKYTHVLSWKLKLTQYELIRTQLLNTASPKEEERMFQRELRSALETYAQGDYLLARLQFRDILSTYGQGRIVDDILFYTAESAFALNFLDEALKWYQQVVEQYPTSPFAVKALIKMLFIHHFYNQPEKVYQIYQVLMEKKAFLEDETSGLVSYLTGFSLLRQNRFSEALSCFANVSLRCSYYYPAQYLSAIAFSNLGQEERAIEIYRILSELPDERPINPMQVQIRNNALLKLGLMYYERGENQKALSLLNRISQQKEWDDLVLLGKAWSAYRAGKPAEALEHAESVLRQSLFSRYIYEAKILSARSRELLGQKKEATQAFSQVLQLGESAKKFLPYTAVDIFSEKNQEKNQSLLSEMNRIGQFLGNTLSVSPSDSMDEFKMVSSRFKDMAIRLDSLTQKAEETQNHHTVKALQEIRERFTQTDSEYRTRHFPAFSTYSDDPILQWMGISFFLRYGFEFLLSNLLHEKLNTEKNLAIMDSLLAQAQTSGHDSVAIQLEIRKDEFEEYLLKLNQYEVWIRENMPEAFYVEIDRWANFSGYGISNINFSMIQELDERMAKVSQILTQLNQVYVIKKQALDERLEGLLREVAQIEARMQAEMQKRRQKEREQFLKQEYFDALHRESPVKPIETPSIPKREKTQ